MAALQSNDPTSSTATTTTSPTTLNTVASHGAQQKQQYIRLAWTSASKGWPDDFKMASWSFAFDKLPGLTDCLPYRDQPYCPKVIDSFIQQTQYKGNRDELWYGSNFTQSKVSLKSVLSWIPVINQWQSPPPPTYIHVIYKQVSS